MELLLSLLIALFGLLGHTNQGGDVEAHGNNPAAAKLMHSNQGHGADTPGSFDHTVQEHTAQE